MGHVATASLQVEAEALAVHEESSHLEEAECVQRVPRIERDLDGFRLGSSGWTFREDCSGEVKAVKVGQL